MSSIDSSPLNHKRVCHKFVWSRRHCDHPSLRVESDPWERVGLADVIVKKFKIQFRDINLITTQRVSRCAEGIRFAHFRGPNGRLAPRFGHKGHQRAPNWYFRAIRARHDNFTYVKVWGISYKSDVISIPSIPWCSLNSVFWDGWRIEFNCRAGFYIVCRQNRLIVNNYTYAAVISLSDRNNLVNAGLLRKTYDKWGIVSRSFICRTQAWPAIVLIYNWTNLVDFFWEIALEGTLWKVTSPCYQVM